MAVVENHHSARKPAEINRLLGPALLAGIVILFFWKIVLTNQYSWLETPDNSYQVLPWFQVEAGEWHAGHFPLWDPYSNAGQPLLGQMQPGAAYPLNWLLFSIPLKHGWIREIALHWYWVLLHYIGALGAYLFCRDLGRSMLASIAGGCVFALGGYVAHTDWPQMINGAIWAPFVLKYLLRVARGYRPLASTVCSGFFLGVAWLSGHHQVPIFLSLAVAASWVWLCWTNLRTIRCAILSIAIAILTSGLQTIPAAEYGRLAVRWTGADHPQGFNEVVPYGLHTFYSLKPGSLLGIFIPGVTANSDPYIGIVASALAILGVILCWSERAVRYLAMFSLGGIFLALGSNSLLHGVVYALFPLVEKARTPAAAIVLFGAGIAPLVAFGIDSLEEASFWSRRFTWILAGIASILTMATLLFYTAKVSVQITEDRLMITVVASALFAALLASSREKQLPFRTAKLATLGLVLFELANVANYWLPENRDPEAARYLRLEAQHSDLIQYLRAQETPARVEYDDKEIPYNIGDWYGIETIDAYVASGLENYWSNSIYNRRVRDLFGVRYLFAKAAQRPEQRQVFKGASGIGIFENTTAFPRVWQVHQAQTVARAAEGRDLLVNPDFDARHKVFLLGQAVPQLENCPAAGEQVDMPRHESNHIEIGATLKCRGMVILSDSWFPGWRATVDGRAAAIEQADGLIRGVVVEAGKHRIEMQYRPWSVLIGAAMSLLGLILTVLCSNVLCRV